MDRRAFISAVGASIVSAPAVGAAQPVPEIGVLVCGTKRLSLSAERGMGELREALRSFGWIDGQGIRITTQFADLKEERLASLAQEFVRRKVAIIVYKGTPPTDAARRATTSIPIVMSGASDPIAAGFTRNLARPDGNVTGTSLVLTETAGKRLQFLKEVVPQLTRTAVLHAGGPGQSVLDEVRAAARQLGLDHQEFVYRGLGSLETQFGGIRAARADSLIVIAAHTIDEARAPLAQLAMRHRLPTAFTFREYIEAGGLLSYGPNLAAVHLHAAYYVDRLLRGAKPADLPIEQPTKFELVINAKTAKALGLTIPQSLLVRADEIIQ